MSFGKILKTYDYVDESGKLLYQNCRMDPASNPESRFYPRRQDENGRWIWNLNGTRRVLYGLPKLLRADSAKWLFYAEGEKDTQTLWKAGLTATTAGSATMWRDEFARFLSDRKVVILPHNDKAGQGSALRVAESLLKAGAEVKIVYLPDVPDDGGDVTDYMQSGGTVESLMALVEQAKNLTLKSEVKPEAKSPVQAAKNNQPWMLTDLGNAKRLVHYHGHNIRYCGKWGKWLIWNDSRWVVDEDGAIFRFAYKTIKKLWDECKAATDSSVQDSIAKWHRSSQTRTKIDGMIYLGRSLPGVAVSPESLDKDPMLLNCQDGTVDLRNGKLKAHDPSDMITRMCPIKYEESAPCTLWLKVLDRIMNSNDDLMGYLQRLFGYCLTGNVIEQILAVLYGLGANGKTLVCETVMNILGDYAAESPPDLLVARGNDHPTEIADLCGRRLVVASETEQGSRLKIQLVKRLTGNTKLKARFMRQDFFEFSRTHKLILCTNNKPAIDEKTNAIWRRVKLIPFSVIIPDNEQDKDLLNKLKAEWPGILHWMVQGCLAWQQNGLMEPEEVIEATWEYRRSQDPLHDFFEDCCKFDSFAITPVSVLKERYETWARDKGEDHTLSATDFNEELRKKGCEYGTKYWGGETQKCWTGLDLKD